MAEFKYKLNCEEPGVPTLQSPRRRRKIFKWVFLAHVGVLFVPLSIAIVWEKLRPTPKPKTITIRLMDPSALRKPSSRPSGAASSGRRSSAPTPSRPAQQKPKKNPPKPVAKPKPAAKPASKPKPRAQHREIVEPTVEVSTPPQKTPQKTTRNPVKPKPVKPRPDPLEGLEVVDPNIYREQPGPATHSTAVPAGAHAAGGEEGGATYGEALVSALYNLWKPPSEYVLNGRKPEVLVRLKLSPTGRVLSAVIVKNSGFAPMDDSVRRLLRSLSSFPAPPRNSDREFDILFIPIE